MLPSDGETTKKPGLRRHERPTYSVIRDAGGLEEPVSSQLVGMDAVMVSSSAAVVVVVLTWQQQQGNH